MSFVWNRPRSTTRFFQCWPHGVDAGGASHISPTGLFYSGANHFEIIPSGLVHFLWSAAAYSVNLTVSLGSTSVSVSGSRNTGTRDSGLYDDDSGLSISVPLGAGSAVTSILQRLEVLPRTYPNDYEDPFYVPGSSAGTRRIDACTVFYDYHELVDPEDPNNVVRNELAVVIGYRTHYPNPNPSERDAVTWSAADNKFRVGEDSISVAASIGAEYGSPRYQVLTTAGLDTTTTISAFGGDLILGHNSEVSVSGSMSISSHLPMV